MDKSVRRVTVVQGSGAHRSTKVVYDSAEDKEEGSGPDLSKLEQGVRHMLKAQMIAAQEAYEAHLKSTEKEGNSWLFEIPGNLMKARKKAIKEMQKAMPKGMPFGMPGHSANSDKED